MVPFLHRFGSSEMEENPLWLIVLCDMMTNLMLFFLVMYALSQQGAAAQKLMLKTFDAKAVVEDPSLKKDEPMDEFKSKEAALLSALKDTEGEVSVTERSIRVRLKDRVLFKFAEAELDPRAAGTLSALARVLREMPNEVVVEGHTDDVPVVAGPYRSNWELSVSRAYAVLERLVQDGVDPHRLVAAGYGEHHPLAANSGEEGRARNRRAEIVILREGKADD